MDFLQLSFEIEENGPVIMGGSIHEDGKSQTRLCCSNANNATGFGPQKDSILSFTTVFYWFTCII